MYCPFCLLSLSLGKTEGEGAVTVRVRHERLGKHFQYIINTGKLRLVESPSQEPTGVDE